jgi:hypothetical protein
VHISETTRLTCGILLLAVPLIQYGGTLMLRTVAFREARSASSQVQQELRHSGHAHSGVLLVLALLCQFLIDCANMPAGLTLLVRIGVVAGAVLVPLGLLFSSGAPPAEQPEPAMQLIFLGSTLLAISLLLLGAALLGVLPLADLRHTA